jgi:hypothetical protein
MTNKKIGYVLLTIFALIGAVYGAISINNLTNNQLIITNNQQHIEEALNSISESNYVLANELKVYTDTVAQLIHEVYETPETEVQLDFSLKAWHRDPDGNLIQFSEHAGTLMNIGKDYIEGLLGNNSTDPSACWISLTNDATAIVNTWTQLPSEIAANNLSRALGTYASTGVGVYTVTYTFTASGAQSVAQAGLNWAPSGDNNLLCADDIADATLAANDTLELQFTGTIT